MVTTCKGVVTTVATNGITTCVLLPCVTVVERVVDVQNEVKSPQRYDIGRRAGP